MTRLIDIPSSPPARSRSASGFPRVRCANCLNWFTAYNRRRPECAKCVPPSPRRTHPVAKVGDMFGRRRVERLLPRDHTCNERVLARCTVCGHEAPAYVFNLRRSKGCRHCGRWPRPVRP